MTDNRPMAIDCLSEVLTPEECSAHPLIGSYWRKKRKKQRAAADEIRDVVGRTPKNQRVMAMDSYEQENFEMDVKVKVDTDRVVRGVQAYEAARAEVKPYVGDVGYAFDSAGKIYKHALRELGHDVSEIHDDRVAEVIWPVLRNKKPALRSRLATDAKAASARQEMFPHGDRLSKSFY